MKQLTQEQLEQVYREHPEWRTEIEVGKWYKYPDNANFLFCVTELIDSIQSYGYGWGTSGKWHDVSEKPWGLKHIIPASDAEVASALIAEANRRYRDGDKLNAVIDDCSLGKRIFSQNLYYQKSDCSLWILNDVRTNYSSCIFKDGKWATVITPASTLAEDIQALKDKYPNYNWTIIAEAK